MDIAGLVVSGVVGAIAAFGGGYWSTRGKTLATAHDMSEVLEQLKATTTAAENVKEQIRDHYGDAAVRRGLLRDRLEKLMVATFDLEIWLEKNRSISVNGDAADVNGLAFAQVMTLQALYFPALNARGVELRRTVLAEQQWMGRMMLAMNEANRPNARAVQAEFGDVHAPLLEALRLLREDLIVIARRDLHA